MKREVCDAQTLRRAMRPQMVSRSGGDPHRRGSGGSRITTLRTVVGIRTERIERLSDHHGAGGGGDPHRGNRTVCGSTRRGRSWGSAPRVEDGLWITTRPPAGAEGSGCTVETETLVARVNRLKGLAPHAVCEAPQPLFTCAVVGIDV